MNSDDCSSLCLLAESYKTGDEKQSALQDFLRHQKGSSIVYVQTHNVSCAASEAEFLLPRLTASFQANRYRVCVSAGDWS